MDALELFVQSSEFLRQCALYSKRSPSNASGSDYSDFSNLWEKEDDSSSDSSVESSPHDVSKLEAYLYYFGIRGPRHRGPKLIYRTSKDVFTPPSGPEQNTRLMQLLPVYEHAELGKDDKWATIRSEAVGHLDKRNIKHSSVDLVRFSWVEEKATVSTPVTIWVGVLPNTLTGEVAFNSSNDILDLLKKHGISDVDVAYRESVVRALSGPELFAPVSDLHPLKDVIDPVTTALSLPIAGLRTLNIQGTMGFYFKVGENLYAVTARHILFPNDEGNESYSYVASGPKKKVVLMGTGAFDNLLASIQGQIGTLNNTVSVLEKRVKAYGKKSEGGGPNAEQAADDLVTTQGQLNKIEVKIDELKKFYVRIKREWTEPTDRVIGYVVWAPPFSASTAPHGYTKDVCVVKLDEKKFRSNFRGNVLDLGPEIENGEFMSLMYPRVDAPSDFDYPEDRLFELRGTLSADEIRTPTFIGDNDKPMQFVIKRGLTTKTTIGHLTGFDSHVRRYSGLDSCNSVEAAVLPYDNDSGPFARGGDSGSLIIDARGKFALLLTTGTGPTDSSDITFGTPMYWLWEIIKARFAKANLYFEDVNK